MTTQAEKFKLIADTIRAKKGIKNENIADSDKIVANNFINEIVNIKTEPSQFVTSLSTKPEDSNFDGAMSAVITAMSYWNAVRNGSINFDYYGGHGPLRATHGKATSLLLTDEEGNEYKAIADGETTEQPNVIDFNGDGVLDCSTFTGLVLRGYDYLSSPFGKAVRTEDGKLEANQSCVSTDILYNSDLFWTEPYFDKQTKEGKLAFVGDENKIDDKYYRILQATEQAEYYSRMGLTYEPGEKEVLPGDLVFFRGLNDDGTLSNHRYLGITHVGIMISPTNFLHMGGTTSTFVGDLWCSEIGGTYNPYLYARPLYGSIEYGGCTELTKIGKVNLIPNNWAGLKEGETKRDDGITLTLNGRKLIMSKSEDVGETGFSYSIVSGDCPIYLKPGTYKLTGVINNTGKNESSVTHTAWGITVRNVNTDASKKITGTVFSSDGTASEEITIDSERNVRDIGGGCTFTLTEPTEIRLTIWVSPITDLENIIYDPVLIRTSGTGTAGNKIQVSNNTYKNIKEAVRAVNNRGANFSINYPYIPNAINEIYKLDPRIIEFVEPFKNGYYGMGAVNCAKTYLNARVFRGENFHYSFSNAFSVPNENGIITTVREKNKNDEADNIEYANIDCSTFVSLCLRGIKYENSPYCSKIDNDGNIIKKNSWNPSEELIGMYGTEGWEFKNLDKQNKYHRNGESMFTNIGFKEGETEYSSIRTAAHIGEYFYKHGYVVYDACLYEDEEKVKNLTELNSRFDLEPGDLLFWANPDNTGDASKRFRGITHVALVSENANAYYHVTGSDSTYGQQVVKYNRFSDEIESGKNGDIDWDDDSHTFGILNLICRPDYRPKMPKGETPLNINLLSYPWTTNRNTIIETNNGITFKVGDIVGATITICGTSTNSFNTSWKGAKNSNDFITLSPGTYQLSGVEVGQIIEENTKDQVALQVLKIDGTDFNPSVRYPATGGSVDTFTITEETNVYVRSYIASGIEFPSVDSQVNECYFQPTLIRIA